MINKAIATGEKAPNVIGENNIQRNENMDKKLRLTAVWQDAGFVFSFDIFVFI